MFGQQEVRYFVNVKTKTAGHQILVKNKVY
jgi:hypothetical protein